MRGHQAERESLVPFALCHQGANRQTHMLAHAVHSESLWGTSHSRPWLGKRRRACVPSVDTPSDLGLCSLPALASLPQRRECGGGGGGWWCSVLHPCPLTLKAGFLSSDLTPHPGVSAGALPRENRELSADKNMKHVSSFWLWGQNRGPHEAELHGPPPLCALPWDGGGG